LSCRDGLGGAVLPQVIAGKLRGDLARLRIELLCALERGQRAGGIAG
jgi:hypothetical protein